MKNHKETIIKRKEKDNYRIVAISDIHAHPGHFEEMLKRLQLETDDILIILGDFINRGPDSMRTIQLVQAIQKRPNTYVLKGNHESFIYHALTEASFSDHFLHFIKHNTYRTLVHEMAEESDFDLKTCTEGKALHHHMNAHYTELLAYLDSLPIILENDDFIFVHGGYAKEADPAKDESKFLKYDNYNELSGINDKPVIVGHWPASNLRSSRFTNLPKFNRQKKIITIDGGLGVKSSGELNALIIDKKDGQITYTPVQVNDFIKTQIKSEHHFQEEDPIYVSFPHFDVDILERKGDFVLCRHRHTQKPLSVFPSLLEEANGQTRIKTTYINTFLNLKKGDEVEVCLRFEDCALVKYKNDFGWVLREQIS